MNKLNVIGVDLAKNVIQVSVLSRRRKESYEHSADPAKFAEFLARQRPEPGRL